jgi:protein gp37
MSGMNKTKIDWVNYKDKFTLNYTWNPLYGCINTCYYCYARKLHNRFFQDIKNGKTKIPDQYRLPFSTLQFFPDRLSQPDDVLRFSTIFVASMSDISYHNPDHIQQVIDVCHINPQHRFLFLTKKYDFYDKFIFPSNCWLGITMVSGECQTIPEYQNFKNHPSDQKFVAIEPLLGSFTDVDLFWARWIIVGKRTGGPSFIPKSDILSIKHDNIYWKNSMKDYVS